MIKFLSAMFFWSKNRDTRFFLLKKPISKDLKKVAQNGGHHKISKKGSFIIGKSKMEGNKAMSKGSFTFFLKDNILDSTRTCEYPLAQATASSAKANVCARPRIEKFCH
jgi:hypothetical protein